MILAGNDKAIINDSLQDLLREKVSVGGDSLRGNREKVITILLKTWLTVPGELETLRDEGLEILQGLTHKDRITVHWGMILAAYPFWGAVAAHTGRLLRLQGTVAASHVQRRLKEEYGERETVSRAARRVLRSFIDWGVLNETRNKGVYDRGERYSIEEPRLIAWVVEASLHGCSSRLSAVSQLINGPSIFPFRFARVSAEQLATLSPRLDILRHGLDDAWVILREES